MSAPPRACESVRTGNCHCDGPLKVAPRSPNAFPALFVTQSLPHTLALMYSILTVLISLLVMMGV